MNTDQSSQALERRKGGRPLAGTDPKKRQQIIKGACQVFSRLGFDASSMADVAREAGVSKATLYVYYENKEELFAAVIAVERERSIDSVLATLDLAEPAPRILETMGRELVRLVTRPKVVQAHRVVFAVVERMPEIGRQMYEGGTRRLAEALAAHLEARCAAGELSIPDSRLAAAQFVELCLAGILRPRLFAVIEEQAGEDEISRTVTSAVGMFMTYYGRPKP